MTTHRLSQRTQNVKRIIGWISFVLFVVTQWNVYPWPLFSLTFYGLFFIWQLLRVYDSPKLWHVPVLAGAALNYIALFANGGRMPVLGRTEAYRWWQPLTEDSRLVFLCDIYFQSSVGDMLIASAGIVALAVWLLRRKPTAILLTKRTDLSKVS